MAQNNVFQGEMDPEIAALLGTEAKPKSRESVPDYTSLFNEDHAEEEPSGETEEPNINSGGFPEITSRFAAVPHKAFQDPNYYKTALSGEGEIAQRVHGILQKYLNAKDPKDRGVYRQQFIPAFWEFLLNIARKAPGKLPDPKRQLLRFGILHPTFLDTEQRTFFSQIVLDNIYSQPIYYLDEWFKAVGTGLVRNSTTDEVRVAKTNTSIKLQQLLEKAQGKLDGARVLLKGKDEERLGLEKNLTERVSQIADHFPVTGLPEIKSCYNETQKRLFAEIQEIMKALIKADHDLDLYIKDFFQAEEDVKNLKLKVEEDGGSVEVDVRAVDTEFETVRQMAKMTIGRQGNHFPIVTNEYFHSMPADVGYRENIISLFAWVESIDPEAFCRSYKNRLNRIVPYVVLTPAYGDFGMCWEPFDRFNRATSRRRIAIPMYPKNLQVAVLSAIGDLRWQVAKEKASYYWMEEGITGNYYQWFQKMKLRGDLKEFFIQDYITWMTKESDGTQKLDKDVRGIFWRYIPFSKAVKEKLKGRSYVYQDLYQRDINRSM
ncbi:MAG: hypothetical protein FWC45_05380, partial [Treponema sp.]|nr:hypothetical protein [Treponema sp.]